MKNFILLILICIAQNVHSQTVESASKADDYIFSYEEVQVKPEFPGGVAKLYSFIGNNFKMPDSKEVQKGKLFTTFVVEPDGSLSNIKVLKDIGFGLGKEAIRVLKMMPKWLPGEHDGKHVRTSFSLPISIN